MSMITSGNSSWWLLKVFPMFELQAIFLPGTLPTLTGSSFEPPLNLELDNDDRDTWKNSEHLLWIQTWLGLDKENRSYMAIILFSISTGYLHRHWLRVGNTAIILTIRLRSH